MKIKLEEGHMKKKWKIAMIVVVALAVVTIAIGIAIGIRHIAYESNKWKAENEKYGIEISIAATSTEGQARIECSGTENTDGLSLHYPVFSLEKKTIWGWEGMECSPVGFTHNDVGEEYTINKAVTYYYNLDFLSHYGSLSNGTYRVNFPIYEYDSRSNERVVVGFCYAVFEISE